MNERLWEPARRRTAEWITVAPHYAMHHTGVFSLE